MGSKNANVMKKHNKTKKPKKNNGLSSNPSPVATESHKREDERSGGGGGGGGGKVISDPRFSSVHSDPRFREAPKRQTKVAIDSRFDRMFTDKSFSSSSAPVDKRGKPKNNRSSQHSSLRHYYKIDEEEEEEEEEEEDAKLEDEGEEEVEESSDEEEGQELLKSDRVKPGRTDAVAESESSESEEEDDTGELERSTDTDTDTDTDEGADEEVYAEEEEAPDMQEEVPEIEKETHRLAVVNMDWRYVKAVDLYVLLSSFVPSNGQIKSVAVYPSEFGLERMKDEEVNGPVGLFDDEDVKSDGDSSDDDLDNEKLRAYEKSRMKYYYAVVECDSITTADYIYKECDGLEFIQSSNALDLRFIPDSMEFKHPPRDVATEAPANYECKDFYTRALQHSKVNLSWDEDEPLRAKTLKRKFNDEQLAELELKEFLTSDESESDDGEDNKEPEDQPDKKATKREKYRALLQSGDGSDDDGEDGGQDMEVTFSTGLEDISKRIIEKKDKKSETVWEAYLRKRREKKKARKNKSKYSSDDDDNSSDADQDGTEEADDFFFEEPAVKKRKKSQSNSDREHKNQVMDGVDKASKEELELLLADDKGTDTGLRGYNLKFKKGKGKRGKEAVDEGKIPGSAYDDPRFAALFKPDYVIDPTDPQFKRSAAYARQLAQKQQKGHLDLSEEREHVKPPTGLQLSFDDSGMMKGKEEGLDASQSKKEKYELSSLVKSIKMKSKQVQLPTSGKIKKDGKLRFKGTEKKRH